MKKKGKYQKKIIGSFQYFCFCFLFLTPEQIRIDGFIINFFEKTDEKELSSVELSFKQSLETPQTKMNITIKSNVKEIKNLFFPIHQSVRIFVKKWIVENITENIKAKLTKNNKINENSEDSLKISLSVNKILQKPKKNQSSVVNCAFCGISFSMDSETLECDKCNFFIFQKKKKR